MPYFRYPQPDSVGVWLLLWIVLPLMTLFLITHVGSVEIKKYKGRKLCAERGYIESMYVPADRFGDGKRYVFRKKINSDGTTNETAKLVISLD